jgi:GNAT superfamily N-acetyltransferase
VTEHAVELRAEPAGGAASQALFAEYMALLRERIGDGFVPSERIFATEEAFAGAGADWLVLYEDGRAVGCGGLRTLAAGVGEIKRMFVTASARRRGHARRLLHELERRAAAHGHRKVLLLSHGLLGEALALYEAEGYAVAERVAYADGHVELWLEKEL